jgi:hypothetical protein
MKDNIDAFGADFFLVKPLFFVCRGAAATARANQLSL